MQEQQSAWEPSRRVAHPTLVPPEAGHEAACGCPAPRLLHASGPLQEPAVPVAHPGSPLPGHLSRGHEFVGCEVHGETRVPKAAVAAVGVILGRLA